MVLQLLCDHRYVSMRQFVVYKLRNIVPISVAKFNVFTREMVKKVVSYHPSYMACFCPLAICIKVLGYMQKPRNTSFKGVQ